MGIVRYENVTICNVTTQKTQLGSQIENLTTWFESRALVSDVANSLRISDKYRVYQDLVNLTFNYTPNMKMISDNQDLYSLVWRNQEWRITDVREANDRMKITLICYYNAPYTAV